MSLRAALDGIANSHTIPICFLRLCIRFLFPFSPTIALHSQLKL